MTKEEFFGKLEKQYQSKKPFVCYRKPGEAEAYLMLQCDKQSHTVSSFDESGFVFAPFNAEENSYLIPQEESENISFQLPDILAGDEIKNETFSGSFSGMEADQKIHENLVQKGVDSIENGQFRKVVLSRSEKVELADPSILPIFKKLLHKYKQAFVYCWFHPETGIWMGATPETLLNVERNRFQTMALAGTQLNKGQEKVEWGDKEIEEQLLVTDFILNSLQELPEIEITETSKPFSAHAGNLLHIQTDISGTIQKQEDQAKLIQALHPTPAVCGLPRKEAFNFILKNENYNREFYSGFLGELNLKKEKKRNANRRNQENQQFAAILKQTNLFVNLRCMKLKDGNARIYIGGGITKDSEPTQEWTETVNKAETMKSVLVK